MLLQFSAPSRRWKVGLALLPLVVGSGALSAQASGNDGDSEPAPPRDAPAAVGDALASGSSRQTAEPASQSSFATPAIEADARYTSLTDIPANAVRAYERAAEIVNAADAACNLEWSLVAAVGRVESDHGRFDGNSLDAQGRARPGIFGPALDGTNGTMRVVDSDAGALDRDRRHDRAVGPMQFIPSTWRVIGVDADQDGAEDPQDIDDAATATGVYLCAGHEDLSTASGRRTAVYRYNHDSRYVELVLSIAALYADGDYTAVPDDVAAAPVLVARGSGTAERASGAAPGGKHSRSDADEVQSRPGGQRGAERESAGRSGRRKHQDQEGGGENGSAVPLPGPANEVVEELLRTFPGTTKTLAACLEQQSPGVALTELVRCVGSSQDGAEVTDGRACSSSPCRPAARTTLRRRGFPRRLARRGP